MQSLSRLGLHAFLSAGGTPAGPAALRQAGSWHNQALSGSRFCPCPLCPWVGRRVAVPLVLEKESHMF